MYISSVLSEIKSSLIFQENDIPQVEPGFALVELKAAALNHRDVWIRDGLYAGVKTGITLGSDGAGVVLIQNGGTNWVNKEVIINPAINWGNNKNAHSPDFKILGLPDNGTFAQMVIVPIENLCLKPDYLLFPQAAALPLAGLTAYRACVTRANIQKNDCVLVTGIGGGVAQMATQIAKALGAEVFVTSSSEDKIQKATLLGAKDGVNYKNSNWEQDLLKLTKRNIDVIIDGAAGEDFIKFIEIANSGARIVNYGGTGGKIPAIAPQRIFWKQLNILGTTMGNPDEFKAMIQLFTEYKLKPNIDKVYNFLEINSALDRMKDGLQFGKIILDFEKTAIM